MGMYDSFYILHDCPRCHLRSEEELQTKDGACTLADLRIGQYASKMGVMIQEGMVEAHGSCSVCSWWTDYHVIIRKGKFFGISYETTQRL